MTIQSLDIAGLAAAQSWAAVDPWLATASKALAVWGAALVPAVLVWLWLRGGPGARRTAVLATLSASGALAAAGLLSFLFYVPRPFSLGLAPNLLDHVADSSFPSDHAAAIAAVALALVFDRRRRLGAALAILAVAVGAARIAAGAHFPSDVVSGIAIGALVAATFRLEPLIQFANFARRLAEALYSGLGMETLATRLHLEKHQETPR